MFLTRFRRTCAEEKCNQLTFGVQIVLAKLIIHIPKGTRLIAFCVKTNKILLFARSPAMLRSIWRQNVCRRKFPKNFQAPTTSRKPQRTLVYVPKQIVIQISLMILSMCWMKWENHTTVDPRLICILYDFHKHTTNFFSYWSARLYVMCSFGQLWDFPSLTKSVLNRQDFRNLLLSIIFSFLTMGEKQSTWKNNKNQYGMAGMLGNPFRISIRFRSEITQCRCASVLFYDYIIFNEFFLAIGPEITLRRIAFEHTFDWCVFPRPSRPCGITEISACYVVGNSHGSSRIFFWESTHGFPCRSFAFAFWLSRFENLFYLWPQIYFLFVIN